MFVGKKKKKPRKGNTPTGGTSGWVFSLCANATGIRRTSAPTPHQVTQIDLAPVFAVCTEKQISWCDAILARDREQSHTLNFPGYNKCYVKPQKKRKEKKSIQFNSVCLKNMSKHGWPEMSLSSEQRKKNEMCERFHSSADTVAMTSLALFKTRCNTKPFLSKKN